MNEIFGRYQIVGRIAQGGMAEILLARPLSGTQRTCALKRILAQFSSDLQFVSMFIDEARITIGLQHENIVRLYDFGQVDGVYFMAIEYVDGTDLSAVMRACAATARGLPPIVAASIAADVARGLAHAHALTDAAGQALGIVHRDVSPQNVLLSSTGAVKITDFGIAAAKNKLTLTSPGVVLGKAAYMAPEQASGRGVDYRCDLWALGVVLWEVLAGDRLFADENPVATLQRVLGAPVPAPSSRQAEIPPALDALVLALLERERTARPTSAATVAASLDDIVAQLAATSPLARHGRFGAAERAAYLASIVWTDDTAPMRPRASTVHTASTPATKRRLPRLSEDDALQRLLAAARDEQDPWLLVDVADRAHAIGRTDVALSGYRTAAAAFAFRGLLIQSLAAHAHARPLLSADEAREDVLLLGELTPGRRSELDELLGMFDGHGFSAFVSRDDLPLPAPVPLLGALGPRELARVAEVVSLRRVKQGDAVLREGDRSHELFGVARGRFVVSCQPGDGQPLTVDVVPTLNDDDLATDATAGEGRLHIGAFVLQQQRRERVFLAGLADGDFFGEFSFLAERPRSATVEAVTDGLLLEIERADVDHIAAVDPAFTAPLLAFYKERVVELMMAKSPVFSLLSPSDRRALLDGATALDVHDGALIVREGTRNDALFFIRRGEVEVFRRDASGLSIFINKLGQGQFFGEVAALKGTPRTVSVRAIGPVGLFQIEGRLLHTIVNRDPRLRALFDATIARRAAEVKARVLEHDRLLVPT